MIRYTPIICCHCDKDTGMFQENFTHLVLYYDVKCPHSQACNSAENCNRCNHYYEKCTKFKAFK